MSAATSFRITKFILISAVVGSTDRSLVFRINHFRAHVSRPWFSNGRIFQIPDTGGKKFPLSPVTGMVSGRTLVVPIPQVCKNQRFYMWPNHFLPVERALSRGFSIIKDLTKS